MKNSIVVLMLMVGLTAMAQTEGNRNGREMNDMTPEQMATLQTKKMTLSLDLTDAQQTQIHALHLENAKTRKAKMEERKAKKEGEEKVKPTSEERFAMQNERLDRQIAQKERMKKILSKEQFDKWEKMARHKGKHHGQKGKKGEGKRSISKEG